MRYACFFLTLMVGLGVVGCRGGDSGAGTVTPSVSGTRAVATGSVTASGGGAGSATPAGAAATASVPAGTATGVATSAPSTAGVIDAGNAARLQAVGEFRSAGAQRLGWAGSSVRVASDEVVTEFDPATKQQALVYAVRAGERVLGLSSGGLVATTEPSTKVVRILDLARSAQPVELRPGTGTASVTFAQGAASTVVGLASGERIEVTLWDSTRWTQMATLTGFDTAAPVYSFVLSPDGRTGAWVSRGVVQFHDVGSNLLGPRLQFEDFVGKAVFSPSGATLATITGEQREGKLGGLLDLWDSVTGKSVLPIRDAALFSDVGFSPDGRLVVTGGDAGATLWSAVDGTRLASLEAGRAGKVRLVGFSPRGESLATVSDEGVVRVWQVGP